MNTPGRRTELESALLEQFRSIEANVGAWVVLPNHYHILASVQTLDQVSALFKQLHGTTSRRWNQEDGMTGKRRVWYKFADRWIRNEHHYLRVLNYIHYNPVKHKYVADPYEWAWSSAHWYRDEKGRAWLRDMWRRYPIERMGQGWDD